jgi:hypothetical protein
MAGIRRAVPVEPDHIDHVLADRRLGVADFGVEDLPGSDHRAIHAQLVCRNPYSRLATQSTASIEYMTQSR